MKFLKNTKLLMLSVSALVLLSPAPVNASGPETETVQPDASGTVSGNDPLPPSGNEPETDGGADGAECRPVIELFSGQALQAAARLEDIKLLLDSLTGTVETILGSIEDHEGSHEAFYKEVLERLCMDVPESGVMLLSDDEGYYWANLSDYYNSGLGFVVLPSRSAFEFYWSRDYYYVSKSGRSWYGVDYIIYRDEPYLVNAYGYDIDTDPGSWSGASDGCYVETSNLSAYEASLAPGGTGGEGPGGDDPDGNSPSPGEFFSQLEAINETLSSMQDADYAYYEASSGYMEDMHRMQSAETASSVILCILLCVVIGIMLFSELFRRFK